MSSRQRYSFGTLDDVLELPDLIAIQRESFNWFLQSGLAETFRDISPIKDFTGTLRLELEFDPDDEDLRPPPKFSVEECQEKDMTYSAPIFVRARFMNATTGEIKEQTVFMGDFPMMTDKGTFIINGTERVVVSQLVRSPGVIFQPGERFRLRNMAKHQLVTGTIHPYRGEWIEFDVEQKPGKDVTAGARRRPQAPPQPLHPAPRPRLRRGARSPASSTASSDHFDFLEGQWEKDRDLAPTQEESLIEIYKRARPGEPPDGRRRHATTSRTPSSRTGATTSAGSAATSSTASSARSSSSSSRLFGIQVERPREPAGRCRAPRCWPPCSYLLHLGRRRRRGYRLDDQDHFANRRIRSVGELIQNQVRIGLSRMERVVRERMTTQDVEAITPQTLINIRRSWPPSRSSSAPASSPSSWTRSTRCRA